MTNRPVVIALGGNAISRRGEEGNIAQQFAHTAETADHIAGLVAGGLLPVITHGNGPQIGNILRRVELAVGEVYPLPLHVCVADSQAGMGYMITQCVANALAARGVARTTATVITRVVVDPADPAMARPTKPIGRFIPPDVADGFRRRYGWNMADYGADGMRRVVASPPPLAIVEMDVIRRMVADGVIVVAAGGGGIPVAPDPDLPGAHHGVDCVIDKDRTSALLAAGLGADTLVIATGVRRVALHFATPAERPLATLTAAEAAAHLADGHFPEGTMGPKIAAALDFLARTPAPRPRVVITDLAHIPAALKGETGTTITRGEE